MEMPALELILKAKNKTTAKMTSEPIGESVSHVEMNRLECVTLAVSEQYWRLDGCVVM